MREWISLDIWFYKGRFQIKKKLENEIESFKHLLCLLALRFPIKFIIIIMDDETIFEIYKCRKPYTFIGYKV